MIVFDELSFANKMIEKGFVKCFSIYELSIYAKYLKYQNQTNEEIEKELIAFSEKWSKDFIYEVDYPKIDKALKSIDEYSLRIAKPTYLTENEWDKIMELNNEKYRRVLFTMLIISKFYKNNNTKIIKEDNTIENKYKDVYFCNFSDSDILKLSGVRFKDKNDKNKMFNYFYNNEYVDITQGKKSIRIISIVDNNSDIKETISDYENIILYYERLIGEKISKCKECERLFRQNKANNREYCNQHKGYIKQETKTITCIDCGEEKQIPSTSRQNERCSECYEVYRKAIINENAKKYYQNKK